MKTISSSMLTIQTGISRWKPVSRVSAVLIFFMQTTSKLSFVELYKDLQLQKFWLITKLAASTQSVLDSEKINANYIQQTC